MALKWHQFGYAAGRPKLVSPAVPLSGSDLADCATALCGVFDQEMQKTSAAYPRHSGAFRSDRYVLAGEPASQGSPAKGRVFVSGLFGAVRLNRARFAFLTMRQTGPDHFEMALYVANGRFSVGALPQILVGIVCLSLVPWGPATAFFALILALIAGPKAIQTLVTNPDSEESALDPGSDVARLQTFANQAFARAFEATASSNAALRQPKVSSPDSRTDARQSAGEATNGNVDAKVRYEVE